MGSSSSPMSRCSWFLAVSEASSRLVSLSPAAFSLDRVPSSESAAGAKSDHPCRDLGAPVSLRRLGHFVRSLWCRVLVSSRDVVVPNTKKKKKEQANGQRKKQKAKSPPANAYHPHKFQRINTPLFQHSINGNPQHQHQHQTQSQPNWHTIPQIIGPVPLDPKRLTEPPQSGECPPTPATPGKSRPTAASQALIPRASAVSS
jgi:hypothetical protein